MDIVLAAVNAGFQHPSLGLRCLAASLREGGIPFALEEGTRREGMARLAERIASHRPALVALSVSIWNHPDTLCLIPLLRSALPEAKIALGGPEPTWLDDGSPLLRAADAVARGEADAGFPEMALALLSGSERREWRFESPELSAVALPYREYRDADLGKFVYLESSRGCPFGCEFCLSSVSGDVRTFPLPPLFDSWEELLDRGALRFKFIDRTFNLGLDRSASILEYWLRRMRPGLIIQVEVVPDRIQEELFPLLAAFPPGSLRLEAGIQSYDPAVLERISRRQDLDLTDRNLRRVRTQTGAVIHADLIAGLPGESLESFGRGLDRLWAVSPHEVQLGLLKRLPGAPIARHDGPFAMSYQAEPPYRVTSTGALSADDTERLARLAKYWELVVNKGRFPDIVAALSPPGSGIFRAFLAFSDELYRRLGRTWGISPQEIRAVWEEWGGWQTVAL